MPEIRKAEKTDANDLISLDNHIDKPTVTRLVDEGRYYVVAENNKVVGWLRYGLFWDVFPFMNMLFLLEEFRGRGFGKKLVYFWEKDMINQGQRIFITSTQADEKSQHFYRKIGYRDSGSFIFPGQEASEIFMIKEVCVEEPDA